MTDHPVDRPRQRSYTRNSILGLLVLFGISFFIVFLTVPADIERTALASIEEGEPEPTPPSLDDCWEWGRKLRAMRREISAARLSQEYYRLNYHRRHWKKAEAEMKKYKQYMEAIDIDRLEAAERELRPQFINIHRLIEEKREKLKEQVIEAGVTEEEAMRLLAIEAASQLGAHIVKVTINELKLRSSIKLVAGKAIGTISIVGTAYTAYSIYQGLTAYKEVTITNEKLLEYLEKRAELSEKMAEFRKQQNRYYKYEREFNSNEYKYNIHMSRYQEILGKITNRGKRIKQLIEEALLLEEKRRDCY